MKKLLLITTCLFAMSGSVFAQHMSPAQQGFAYQEQMRMRQQYQQQNYAAQQRAQQRRQQAYINRMRNKKWYGAIVHAIGQEGVGYAVTTGYSSKRRAVKVALNKYCQTRKCKVLATFANTCAMTSHPVHEQESADAVFVAFDKVAQNAIVKAVRSCETVHGANQCGYSTLNRRDKAVCSGYEYGYYGQR